MQIKCVHSITRVNKLFVCRGCTDQPPRRTDMDIRDGASLELVDKFCYVGEILSVHGDAHAAVEDKVHKGWN